MCGVHYGDNDGRGYCECVVVDYDGRECGDDEGDMGYYVYVDGDDGGCDDDVDVPAEHPCGRGYHDDMVADGCA